MLDDETVVTLDELETICLIKNSFSFGCSSQKHNILPNGDVPPNAKSMATAKSPADFFMKFLSRPYQPW